MYEVCAKVKYVIDKSFVGLNEYINAERSNRYAGASIKRAETNAVALMLKGKEPIKEYPVKLKFTWYVANKRMDGDNRSFAKKFILDGMAKAGVIKNDNLNHIIGFVDEFVFVDSKAKEKVEIEVI